MKGWKHDSYRHSLAARGIRTAFAEVPMRALLPSTLAKDIEFSTAKARAAPGGLFTKPRRTVSQVLAGEELMKGEYISPLTYNLTPEEKLEIAKSKVSLSLPEDYRRLDYLDKLGETLLETVEIRPGEDIAVYNLRVMKYIDAMGLPTDAVAEVNGKDVSAVDIVKDSFVRAVNKRFGDDGLKEVKKYTEATYSQLDKIARRYGRDSSEYMAQETLLKEQKKFADEQKVPFREDVRSGFQSYSADILERQREAQKSKWEKLRDKAKRFDRSLGPSSSVEEADDSIGLVF